MQEIEAWRLAHHEATCIRHLITLAEHAATAHLVPHTLDDLHARLQVALQAAHHALAGATRLLRGAP
jgi:hypothetical protein